MASKPKKSAMKKDGGEKGTRPASSRGPSFPRSGSISMGKSKQAVEILTKENEELQGQVEALTTKSKLFQDNWITLTTKLVQDAKTKGFQLGEEDQRKALEELSVDVLLDLINSLAHKQILQKQKANKGSVEARIEELETRITQMNMNLVKLLQAKMNLEAGLDAIQQCASLDDAKHKARFLLFETKGSEVFTFDDSDNDETDEENEEKMIIKENKATSNPGKYQVSSIVKELKTFQLSPPVRKLPGDTLVSKMDAGLQHYLISELSLYKTNGADWRMMAERVGISMETIAEWQRFRLEYPMKHVFETWARSPAATMRMLHRHLVSPQMKAVILARRISDFYQVD
ncbi:uncharacterized protein LOC110456737 [Mizuhopecten yessoensis]|uniref:Death domain-containing protein n=1 Tax=Mizuhopecten yessoensis TaxID=6573 RepID=A0A210QAA5_MIZYE|nr:uncharacterized protein LOC110456737 [Mizuhopecten yessoensis]XP_021363336.1 uncharacterized protein LOC110456737 [Mizuhopecten yessoensis]OWF45674.1 hypothetical protein KP79_PYT10142 [Mizuhopecten yessoensis]